MSAKLPSTVGGALAAAALLGGLAASAAADSLAAGITLTLTLQDGQQLQGELRDHDDIGVVLAGENGLAAVAWDEVSTSSALAAKRQILAAIRGSENNLTAEDHFQLGYFLAVRNRHAAAAGEFRKATQRDPRMGQRVQQAWRQIRAAKEQNRKAPDPSFAGGSGRAGTVAPSAQPGASAARHRRYTVEQHRTAVEAYRRIGEQVRAAIAPDLVLLETQHFLIWTDWPEEARNLIPDWAEEMYRVLCAEFAFTGDEPVWLGKCPVYCFSNKVRFLEFARTIDEHDAGVNLAYTRTAPNGYAHVVLRRLGSSGLDLNRFATTMVHEASHAFMHNYRSTRELPAWLSEGLADYIAEKVLGQRCVTGENAMAIARQLAATGEPIAELFAFQASPPGNYYPIAHSVVDFLIRTDHQAFVGMVDDIKEGLTGEQALARHYQGWDYRTLEQKWRAAHR